MNHWVFGIYTKREQTRRVLRQIYYSLQSKDSISFEVAVKQNFSEIQFLEILYVIVDTRQSQKTPTFFLTSMFLQIEIPPGEDSTGSQVCPGT